MKNNKKDTKRKDTGKKSLSVNNFGDHVIIRNRNYYLGAALGILIFIVSVIGAFYLRDAWSLPFFWGAFVLLLIGIAYYTVKTIISKIVLDSRDLTMTIYNPFVKRYNFADVNYVDRKTVHSKDGGTTYAVIVYIGNGKRSVEVASQSLDQADEIEVLMRRMFTYQPPLAIEEKKDEPKNEDASGKEKVQQRDTLEEKRRAIPVFKDELAARNAESVNESDEDKSSDEEVVTVTEITHSEDTPDSKAEDEDATVAEDEWQPISKPEAEELCKALSEEGDEENESSPNE